MAKDQDDASFEALFTNERHVDPFRSTFYVTLFDHAAFIQHLLPYAATRSGHSGQAAIPCSCFARNRPQVRSILHFPVQTAHDNSYSLIHSESLTL